MSNHVKDVSLDLSEFNNTHDGKIFEEGAVLQRSTSTTGAKSKWSDLALSLWDVIFIVSSAFAVFIDPLICYIPVIDDTRKCYSKDETLMWSFLALRSTGDLFYALDIVVFLRRSRDKDKAKSFGSALIQFLGGPDTKISKILLGQEKLLIFLRILPRICAALPVLQAILLGKYETRQLGNSRLLYLIPIQYSVRAYNLYRWLDDHAKIDTTIKRFLKALLDLLPFALAAHLFGALWYYFSVNAEVCCWAKHLCDIAKEVCGRHNFYCSKSTESSFSRQGVNMTFLSQSCAVNGTKDVTTSPFDFGIYQYALQSDLTRTRNLSRKILQCFWWGLRNLSSFGSNLQTGFENDEIILSIVISISGLALFLVYLNARVQAFQTISRHKQEDMQAFQTISRPKQEEALDREQRAKLAARTNEQIRIRL